MLHFHAASAYQRTLEPERSRAHLRRESTGGETWLESLFSKPRLITVQQWACSQGPACLSIPRQLPAAPMMVFPVRIERANVATIQCPHDADPREHRWVRRPSEVMRGAIARRSALRM